jgi:processive 1,2-diacylglycerol beta-glucosyltransferase
MLKRALILSASSGNGHVRAAQALEKSFAQVQLAEEVVHIDALKYTSFMLRNVYSKGYAEVVNNAPAVMGWLYDFADKPWKDERERLAFDRLNTIPLAKFIVGYKPELIVCTHFLPAEIVSWLLCRKKIKSYHAIVVTDFDAHAMWLCRHYDRYFTAIEETSNYLQYIGVPKAKLSVEGIPIDPVFDEEKDKIAMRKKIGLDLDKPTVLISSGGFGFGPMEQVIKAMQQVKHPLQVLSMCGKNEKLKTKLEQLAQRLPADSPLSIFPMGYTQQMDEYMSAADILLGKPGGLTTSEALAKGLVFVVVNPIPGQEERNSDHLLEEGVGIRCNNLPTLAYKLDKLLDDPNGMRSKQENAKRLGRPQAALAIARDLAECCAVSALPSKAGTDHDCSTVARRILDKAGNILGISRLRKELKLIRPH